MSLKIPWRIARRDLLAHKVYTLLAILLIAAPTLLTLGTAAKLTAHARDAVIPAWYPNTEIEAVAEVDGHPVTWHDGDAVVNLDDELPRGTVRELIGDVVPNRFVLGGGGHHALTDVRLDAEHVPVIQSFEISELRQARYVDGGAPGPGQLTLTPQTAEALGAGVGDTVELGLGDAYEPRIVSGISEPALVSEQIPDGTERQLASLDQPGYFITFYGPEPIGADEAKALAGLGLEVTSRTLIDNPVPGMPTATRYALGELSDMLRISDVIVVVALALAVLLLTPFFTTASRRHERMLAQLEACGAKGWQTRGILFIQALIISLLAGLVALVGLGVGLAIASLSGDDMGRYITWWHLPIAVAFAAVLGMLAAALTSWRMGRGGVRRSLAPAISRRPSLIPLILAVVFGVAVVVLTGKIHADLASFIQILFALTAAACSGLALAWVARWPLGRAWSLAGRFSARALRRTAPGTAALALAFTGLAAGQVFIDDSAHRWNTEGEESFLHSTSEAIVVLDAYGAGGDDEARLGEELARIGATDPIASSFPLRTLDRRIPVIEGSPDEANIRALGPNLPALIVDDALAEHLELTEDQRTVLSRGGVLVPEGLSGGKAEMTIAALSSLGDGYGPVWPTDDALVSITVPVAEEKMHHELLLSPKAAEQLGTPVVFAEHVTFASAPPPWRGPDTEVSQALTPRLAPSTWAAIAILWSAVIVLNIAAIILVVGLAVRETQPELDVVEDVGADPGLRRRLGAALGGQMTLAASLLGLAMTAVWWAAWGRYLVASVLPTIGKSLGLALIVIALGACAGWLATPRRDRRARE